MLGFAKYPEYNQLAMSRINVTWVIRNSEGQLKGPYSTEAILRMISEGVFSGDEMISKQPGGQWQKISREPEFYDKLLEALEGVVNVDANVGRKMEAETVIMPMPSAKPQATNPALIEKSDINKTKTEKDGPRYQTSLMPADENAGVIKNKSSQHTSLYTSPGAGPHTKTGINSGPTQTIKNIPSNEKDKVIDLANLAKVEVKVLKKNIKLPVLVLAVAVLLLVAVLFSPESAPQGKIHLLAPGPSKGSLSDAEVRAKLTDAIKMIEFDTYETYLSAQNKLVSIIEGAPTNIEVRALLCVVYNELWPYAMQDAQDIKTITIQTQQTRTLNVVSPFGQVCEVVKLLTAGRLREAKGQVESTLEESDSFSLLPVLYSYKAELLFGESDFINAIPYFEKSIQMWGAWLQPHVALARVYMGAGDYTNAIGILQKVVQVNPRHKEAQVLQGIAEYRGVRNVESAFTLLNNAFSKSTPIPAMTEAEGLQILSEIFLSRNDKSKALEAAQKAYYINPNNPELKQLVLRLGGSDKITGAGRGNSEMLYLGDQYVRQGDYLAAQAEYKAAFELDPKNGMAALKAAKALWELNQGTDAIVWLGKAVGAEPKLISAYVLQADYLSQRYDFQGALKSLTIAMKISPNNHEVLRGMAQLELRKNNTQGAISYAQRAANVYQGDVATFILLSQANLGLANAIVAVNKKEIERKENAAKDAVRYATKAVEIDSTNPEAQINYAKVIAQTNGVDAGIMYIQELIKRFSYTMSYRVALAEIYQTEDRFNHAMNVYSKVIEFEPRNKKAFLGLGDCQKATGLTNRALKSYFSAAVIDPSDGEALFRAGQLYLEMSKFEDAIQQFQRVQRINENYPRTSYYIGKAAFASGDFNLAMESAKLEKKKNPNLADSYILSAEVFYAKKQYNECANEYATAMKLRPQGADIYVKSAQCYRQAGSLDVAEDMLTLASARESGYAEIYREQGAIYEIKGDQRSAAQAYDKYLGLSPNAPDRAMIEQKLQQIGN